MSEEDNDNLKKIRAAAASMIRVVEYPETGEHLVVFDPAGVPEGAVLVNVARWGAPIEKGAKAPYGDEHVFSCKPMGSKNPEKRFGKQPALTSYKLMKRHNNRMFAAPSPGGGGSGAAGGGKEASAPSKKKKARSEKEEKTPKETKKAKKAYEPTMDEVAREAIRAINAFVKSKK